MISLRATILVTTVAGIIPGAGCSAEDAPTTADAVARADSPAADGTGSTDSGGNGPDGFGPGDTGTEEAGPDATGTDATGTDATGTDDTGTDDTGTDDTGTDDTGTEQATGDTGLPDGVLSFGQLFDQVLQPQGCTAGYCHGAQAGGMLLQSADQAYDQMVGVAASTLVCGLDVRVVPGDAASSVLWARVDPEQPGCESKMPAGSQGLGAEDAAKVFAWIQAGAPK